MRYGFIKFLLVIGLIGGLASGFWSHCHRKEHRAAFEQHIADVCVASAQRVLSEKKSEP